MSNKTKKLMKENKIKEKELNKTNSKNMIDIVVYLRSANISDYHQEIIRYDIINMLIEGQRRGLHINDILGEDYKTFCDEVIAEIPKLKTKDKILKGIRGILPGIISLIIIWMSFGFFDIFTSSTTYPSIPFTLGNLISGFLIICFSLILINFISKSSFSAKNGINKKTLFTLCLLLFLTSGTSFFITIPLFEVHFLVIIFILLGLSIAYVRLNALVQN